MSAKPLRLAKQAAGARAASPADSFTAAEAVIDITSRRLSGFPAREATLVRLSRHIHKLSQELVNQALRAHALTAVSYNTLMMLYGTADQRLSPSQLAEASGEKRTNITRICDELTGKGLIERVAGVDDRRSVVVSLTRRGVKLVESLQPAMAGLMKDIYGEFDAAELRELQRLLRKLVMQLDRHGAADGTGHGGAP